MEIQDMKVFREIDIVLKDIDYEPPIPGDGKFDPPQREYIFFRAYVRIMRTVYRDGEIIKQNKDVEIPDELARALGIDDEIRERYKEREESEVVEYKLQNEFQNGIHKSIF